MIRLEIPLAVNKVKVNQENANSSQYKERLEKRWAFFVE